MKEDGAAAVQDPFWGTLHHQQVFGLGRVWVLVNGQLRRRSFKEERLGRWVRVAVKQALLTSQDLQAKTSEYNIYRLV